LTEVGIEDENKTIQANLVLKHIDLTSVYYYFAWSCIQT